MKPIIGILGGMGPRATVLLEQTLLNKLSGGDQSLPKIISINDGSIPDRTDFLLGKGLDPVPKMAESLQLLEMAGAEIVCIPCNTACAPLILSRLQSMSDLPMINLPETVVGAICEANIKRVFVLATQGTIKSEIYRSVCKQHNISCEVPNGGMQILVSSLINAIKTNDTTIIGLLCAEIQQELLALNTNVVILGCTELSFVSSQIIPKGCQVFDSIDILAEKAVSYVKEKSNVTRPIYN